MKTKVLIEIDVDKLKPCSKDCTVPIECAIVGYLSSIDKKAVFGMIDVHENLLEGD